MYSTDIVLFGIIELISIAFPEMTEEYNIRFQLNQSISYHGLTQSRTMAVGKVELGYSTVNVR